MLNNWYIALMSGMTLGLAIQLVRLYLVNQEKKKLIETASMKLGQR